MYRAAAVIVLCLALVTILGSLQRSNSDQVGRELVILRDEVKGLRSLQHDINTLSQEVDELKAKLATAAVSTGSAVTEASYQPTVHFRDDPFIGIAESPVLLMMFGDYQCKPCRSFVQKTLPELRGRYIESGKAVFVYRDYPLGSNTNAREAATFAHCAGEQGAYWEAFGRLFGSQQLLEKGDFDRLASDIPEINQEKFARCRQSSRYAREMDADILEGKRLGAKGAPGFFLGRLNDSGVYSGIFIRGAQPLQVFSQEIEKLLRKNSG